MRFYSLKNHLKNYSLLLVLGLILLASCSSTPTQTLDAEDPDVVEELYNRAQGNLDRGLYRTAATQFDEIERLHPYSVWAKRASLMSAFALYKHEQYDRAVVALDRFIQLHPADERVDYAYYLRALCYYEQISDVRRDQKMSRLALENLNEVIRRFPNSDYAREARLKRDLTYDHLAGQEMEIGRYYLRQGIPNAAIRRFKNVIDNYQTTTHAAEALYRLVESYLNLGLREEAIRNAAVLGHNYPGSDWYQDAYDLINTGRTSSDQSFWGSAWRSMTD